MRRVRRLFRARSVERHGSNTRRAVLRRHATTQNARRDGQSIDARGDAAERLREGCEAERARMGRRYRARFRRMKPPARTLAVSVAAAMFSMSLFSACGEQTTDTTARTPASDTGPLAQLPGTAKPLHYRLSLDVDPERERFNGIATIDVALSAPTRRLWMHGNKLDVAHIALVEDRKRS